MKCECLIGYSGNSCENSNHYHHLINKVFISIFKDGTLLAMIIVPILVLILIIITLVSIFVNLIKTGKIKKLIKTKEKTTKSKQNPKKTKKYILSLLNHVIIKFILKLF